MDAPATNLIPHCLGRSLTYRRIEAYKKTPLCDLDPSGLKRKAQKVELYIRGVALALIIFAIDNPRLFQIQLQFALSQSAPYSPE
jgi:hypothetical protein